jgi:hypothetical protein
MLQGFYLISKKPKQTVVELMLGLLIFDMLTIQLAHV